MANVTAAAALAAAVELMAVAAAAMTRAAAVALTAAAVAVVVLAAAMAALAASASALAAHRRWTLKQRVSRPFLWALAELQLTVLVASSRSTPSRTPSFAARGRPPSVPCPRQEEAGWLHGSNLSSPR